MKDFWNLLIFFVFYIIYYYYIIIILGEIRFLLVYLDEILFTGSNSTLVQRLIILLSLEFKLRDSGATHYFLGIVASSIGMGPMLSHQKYVLDILYCTSMSLFKPVDTLTMHITRGMIFKRYDFFWLAYYP